MRPSQYASVKHKDVLVWEIDDNFELTVKAIHNIEITSEQVKDNIDKVGISAMVQYW